MLVPDIVHTTFFIAEGTTGRRIGGRRSSASAGNWDGLLVRIQHRKQSVNERRKDGHACSLLCP